jgi:DNA-binding transcriptional ArsR family regulator
MTYRVGDVFTAIADPSRRAILGLLAGAELPVKAIAERFAVTRPAVAKHLAVLERAGLVQARRSGRLRLYRLDAKPLRDVQDWLALYEPFWAARLRGLKARVEARRR